MALPVPMLWPWAKAQSEPCRGPSVVLVAASGTWSGESSPGIGDGMCRRVGGLYSDRQPDLGTGDRSPWSSTTLPLTTLAGLRYRGQRGQREVASEATKPDRGQADRGLADLGFASWLSGTPPASPATKGGTARPDRGPQDILEQPGRDHRHESPRPPPRSPGPRRRTLGGRAGPSGGRGLASVECSPSRPDSPAAARLPRG